MNDRLLMIMPSRGRPERAVDAIQQWQAHSTCSDLLLCLDDDDPERDEYERLIFQKLPCEIDIRPRLRLVPNTERAAKEHPGYAYYGSMGDDHLCRTPGWDRILVDRIKANGGWGIAYGDDLLQHENMPTACIISANIINTLGHMTLPGLTHYYVDNYWKELGEATGTLLYEPSVIIEHMHHFNGKAEEDQTYRENNAPGVSDHDQEVFERWQREQKAADVTKIKEAMRRAES